MSRERTTLADVRRRLAARGWTVRAAHLLPGDVSPRRYLRLELASGERAIAALYPPAIRDAGRRFLATTELLDRAGVRVPAVLDHDLDAGWMLVEDLGPATLFELDDWSWDRRRPFFTDAVTQIARIQGLPAAAVGALNPPLDRALLARELEQTWEEFLRPREWPEDDAAALRRALDRLCVNLAADRPVVCHRDLMARNLVPLGQRDEETPRVGILDHQDTRLGPPYYDLASLLNDSLFPPPAVETDLLADVVTTPAARYGYRRAAAQRTLKALGTFARCARQGSSRHAALIPATAARALEHLRELPETAALATLLERRLESSAQKAVGNLLDS